MESPEKRRKVLLRFCRFLGIFHWVYNSATQRYEQARKSGLHRRVYRKTMLKCLICATYILQVLIVFAMPLKNMSALLTLYFVECSAYTLRQMCRLMLQYEQSFLRTLNELCSIREQLLHVLRRDMFEKAKAARRTLLILRIRCQLSWATNLLIVLPAQLVLLKLMPLCILGIYQILLYELLFYALQMFQVKVYAFYANANALLSSSAPLRSSELRHLLQTSWQLSQLQQKVLQASSTFLICIFNKFVPSMTDLFFAVCCLLTERKWEARKKWILILYDFPGPVLVILDLIAVAYINELGQREMQRFADAVCFQLTKRTFRTDQKTLFERETQNLLLRLCINKPELNALRLFKIDRAFAFEFAILLSLKTIELIQYYLEISKYGTENQVDRACDAIYFVGNMHMDLEIFGMHLHLW